MTSATKPRIQRRRAVPALVQNFVQAQQPTVARMVPDVTHITPAARKPLRTMTWQGTTISKYADGYHAKLASGREVTARTAFGLLKGLVC